MWINAKKLKGVLKLAGLANVTYEDYLAGLKLFSSERRHQSGDQISMFRIINDFGALFELRPPKNRQNHELSIADNTS